MELFITLFTVYTLISSLFIKRSNVLFCGIWGGSAKEGKKLSAKKLETLGLFNEERGTDGCGYYFNGNHQKHFVHLDGKWSEYISENFVLRGEENNEIFLGHARKNSTKKGLMYCHPLRVNNIILTHNGTLNNEWYLSKEYNITYDHLKLDSLLLAECLQGHGFDVLNKYDGFAALAFHYTDDPYTLYLYKGGAPTTNKEERPLYILETKEGIYYSSLEKSLWYIANKNEYVKELEVNKVYKIVKGIVEDIVYEVKRKPLIYNAAKTTESISTTNNFTTQNNVSCGDLSILTNETRPNSGNQDLFYRSLRYWDLEENLLHGIYKINKNGEFEKTDGDLFYFIKGVMIDNSALYLKALDVYNSMAIGSNFAMVMSEYSVYPVCNIKGEAVNILSDYSRKVYLRGLHTKSDTFTPKFSCRTYSIWAGLSHTVTSSDSNDFIAYSYSIIGKNSITMSSPKFPQNEELSRLLIRKYMKEIITIDNIDIIPEIYFYYIEQILFEGHDANSFTNKEAEAIVDKVIGEMLRDKQSLISRFGDEYGKNLRIEEAVVNILKEMPDVLDWMPRYQYMDIPSITVIESEANKLKQFEEYKPRIEQDLDSTEEEPIDLTKAQDLIKDVIVLKSEYGSMNDPHYIEMGIVLEKAENLIQETIDKLSK